MQINDLKRNGSGYVDPTAYAGMKSVVKCENESDRKAAECAARVCFSVAQKRPDSSVILPTGRSATILFRAMLRVAAEYDDCPFGDATLISDTETFGVWREHDSSRTRHIYEMLINPLKRVKKEPSDEQIQLLSGIYTDSDPVKKAQKTIRMFPPSIHLIAVAPTGEILAYEVGTYDEADEIIDDAPCIVEVGEHSRRYIDPNQPSKSIVSIGLGTSLAADLLIILIFDIKKANILNRMLKGPPTSGIPATLLRKHPHAFIITTKNVAQEANIENFVIPMKNSKEGEEWILSK